MTPLPGTVGDGDAALHKRIRRVPLPLHVDAERHVVDISRAHTRLGLAIPVRRILAAQVDFESKV